MDTAVNSKTGEIVSAISIGLDYNASYVDPYNEKWYAHPLEIESFDKNKIDDITKIEVKYRKDSLEIINKYGTKYNISPCFYIINKTELGINTAPENKEHKLAKNWIFNCAKNKDLSFIYSKVTRPFDYSNKLNISELNIDYNKLDVEVPVSIKRKRQRADIILPFLNYHELFGAGIIIEVQFSKQTESETEERSVNWAIKGYSICWVKIDDFKNLSDDLIELNDNTLNIEVFSNTLRNYSLKYENDFRIRLQEFYRASYDKIKEFNDTLNNFKKDITQTSAQKVIETSDKIKELKSILDTREAILINKLSSVENNPYSELFATYKEQLEGRAAYLINKLDENWERKMKELNYPFLIGECNKCHNGYMSKGQTKNGKWRYSCNNYPLCKNTIWINNIDLN